ncbi:MAG: N-6 DNA methylase [Caldilineaceae bacterium]|nr:N-6 DNA methylase [Caldilineaceae bacterium]
MARTRTSHGFTALKIEGGIIPPDFLQTIAELGASRQTSSDYDISKSLAIKEELARYWRIASDLYATYSERHPREDLIPQRVGVSDWLVPLLRSVFNYDDLNKTGRAVLDEREYRLTHRACSSNVPLLLVTRHFDLDKADRRFGHDGRRQAPHDMMQEFLNAEDASLWGIVSNGFKLRLLRDNPSLTRPSYLEADLELIFEEELYPDFAALWLAIHASRLRSTGNTPSNCIIETWRDKAHETGERALENLREGVTEALRQLGNGFVQHKDNDDLRAALGEGSVSREQYFQQLLRLVYRLIFLFSAEERNLLHAPDATEEQRKIFAEGYSLSRLRERAERRRHYDHHQDLWQSLQITFKALARGASPIGLPALGGLFHSGQCSILDSSAISNQRLLEAIRSLGSFRTGTAVVRVNYRDMGTEELGSVYESLLELQPVLDVSAVSWTFSFLGDGNGEKVKGSEKKLTGSYYTPPSLVNELIKSALEPVLAQAVADHPANPKKAILDLNVVDPACGSGHFLLAAARRMAAEIVRIDSDGENSDEGARQHALREVVQHCIYGVDKNELAVELCKTALWIETVEPGKPLTFLNAHIQHGDSLVGILAPELMAGGIPSGAYKALTGDDKAVCNGLKKRNRQSSTSVQYSLYEEKSVYEVASTTDDLDRLPEDSLDDVERKQETYEASFHDKDYRREKLRADLFVGAFFAEKKKASSQAVPYTEDLVRIESGDQQRNGVEATVEKLAEQHGFFHWHLAFADIMQKGGFDVVLGNPPWEVSQLSEEEYFAVRAPSIASLSGRERKQAISQLKEANPSLWNKYQLDRRGYDARNSFCRGSSRFTLTALGKLNSYALFAEAFLQLLSPKGQAGLIVPTGIATDNSTRKFFDEISTRQRLTSLYDFENREALFAGVHLSYKFCLLTLSGTRRPVEKAEFAFFLHQTEQLRDPDRRFSLSAEDFALFNPNTRTCPVFRTRWDMEISRKMYHRAGVFWEEARGNDPETNPWGVSFMQMFNMTSHSHLFRRREQLEEEGWQLYGNVFSRGGERYLPLYEAKLFHQYDHRFATFEGVSAEGIRKGNARPMSSDDKRDPHAVALPRYWVPEDEVLNRLDKRKGALELTNQIRSDQIRRSPTSPSWVATGSQENHAGDRRTDGSLQYDFDRRFERFRNDYHPWLAVFRDISSPTNQRTSIFAFTRETAMNHKAPLLKVEPAEWLQSFRNITRATDERTFLTGNIARIGVGHSAPLIDIENTQAIASALVLANLNSLPLDWAARCSLGGVNMAYFIVKQLPVLPPETYLEDAVSDLKYVELVVPRTLELTYTAQDLKGFARDLGYQGPPFPWDDDRRHRLQSELDAIYSHMYRLDRADIEWILDAPPPSSSFPALKRNEIDKFGEYRTQRYVLHAYDQLARGELPDLDNV